MDNKRKTWINPKSRCWDRIPCAIVLLLCCYTVILSGLRLFRTARSWRTVCRYFDAKNRVKLHSSNRLFIVLPYCRVQGEYSTHHETTEKRYFLTENIEVNFTSNSLHALHCNRSYACLVIRTCLQRVRPQPTLSFEVHILWLLMRLLQAWTHVSRQTILGTILHNPPGTLVNKINEILSKEVCSNNSESHLLNVLPMVLSGSAEPYWISDSVLSSPFLWECFTLLSSNVLVAELSLSWVGEWFRFRITEMEKSQ